MSEFENPDDDIFADIYDDDEPAPPQAAEAPAPAEPEPSYPVAQHTDAHTSVPQQSSNDAVMDDAGGQGYGANNGYGGDSGMGYGGREESHEPVGMKEDG